MATAASTRYVYHRDVRDFEGSSADRCRVVPSQCADLTLSSRATISNSTCKNATTENGHDDDEGEGESHEDDGALVQRVSGFVAAAMGLVALTAFL